MKSKVVQVDIQRSVAVHSAPGDVNAAEPFASVTIRAYLYLAPGETEPAAADIMDLLTSSTLFLEHDVSFSPATAPEGGPQDYPPVC